MKYLTKFLLLCGLVILLLTPLAFAQQNSESDDFSYALKLYNEKFYTLAAQQFSRFVNNYPASDKIAEAGYYSGMALYNLEEYEAARVEFQGVAVDNPSHKRSADSWYMIGECYLRQNNPAEAAKAFETVKILHPGHPNAAQSILRSGKLYKDLGNLEKAEQLFTLIQNRYLESTVYFPALIAHGSLFLQKGANAKAEEKLRKVLEGSTNSAHLAEVNYILGKMYYSQGFISEAQKYFKIVTDNHTGSRFYIPSTLKAARILMHREKYQEAGNLLNRGLSSDPDPELAARLHEGMGDIHFLASQYALALKSYEKSSSEFKDKRFVLRRLKAALSWSKQKNPLKAQEQLESIIDDTVYSSYAGYQEAKKFYFDLLLQTNSNRLGIAKIYQLRTATGIDRSDLEALIMFLIEEGEWLQIIKELEPYVYGQETDVPRDEFIFEIASAYENLGKYDESIRFYQKLKDEYAASELKPLAEEKIAYINDYYLKNDSFSNAAVARMLSDFLHTQDKARSMYSLGNNFYSNLKDYNSALAEYRRALELNSDAIPAADIHFKIALCLRKLAGIRGTPSAERTSLLSEAKKEMSFAMENLTRSSTPDLISWRFVELGIEVDQPSVEKQIGYFKTLVSKYKASQYMEEWMYRLAQLYTESDTSGQKPIAQYELLIKSFPESENLAEYLYNLADLKAKYLDTSQLDAYRHIAITYPGSAMAAKALNNIGLALEKSGNFKDARAIYDRLIADFYYTRLAERAKERIGDIYLLAGENKAALEAYRRQLSTIPADDVVLGKEFVSGRQKSNLYKIGKAHYAQEEWIPARQNLSNYLLGESNGLFSDDACYLLGNVYDKLGDPANAIVSFIKVSNRDEALYLSAQRKIADIYFVQGNYSESGKFYAGLASKAEEPGEQGEIRSRHIISLIRGGKIEAAGKEISKHENMLSKADKNFLAEFQFEFGQYYRINKNFSRATGYFENVIKKYKKSAWADDAEYYLALTNIALNKHKEALDILAGFAAKYPRSENLGPVFNTLGGIYFRSEKYESALTSFKRAMEKPLDPEQKRQVMSNLIRTYTFVNFWDAALALSRQYVALYPDADDVMDKKILIGRAYTYLNQIDRAVEILKETRLVADSEREPEIQFYIGDAYFKAGQYENAIAEYVKIPFLSRKTKLQWEASALYYSGQAYEKLGRNDEAIRMYQEIVNRPGIDLVLKKDAQKRIAQIQN